MPKTKKPALDTTLVPVNEKSKSKVNAKFIKAKKVINNNIIDEHIVKSIKKRGKPKNAPKQVLYITDWLYITCDKCCWKLMEVNDTLNPTTKEKYPDKALKYAPYLNDMLKICSHLMLKIPESIEKLNQNFNSVYSLIDARIPTNIRPKDLFELEEED